MDADEALEKIMAGVVVVTGTFECNRISAALIECYQNRDHSVLDFSPDDFLEYFRNHQFREQQ